jgi:hypothetical protein
MKLSTRAITSAACAAAALLLTPAAAWATLPAPDGGGHVQPAPLKVVAQPTAPKMAPRPTNSGGQGAVQMAVAMAIGAAVATAVRRRRPAEPERLHSIVEPFPFTADILAKD